MSVVSGYYMVSRCMCIRSSKPAKPYQKTVKIFWFLVGRFFLWGFSIQFCLVFIVFFCVLLWVVGYSCCGWVVGGNSVE